MSNIEEEPSFNKTLIKIVDILGRETKFNSNTFLFYLYSDGSFDKKLIIE